jgi:hypothetical protein
VNSWIWSNDKTFGFVSALPQGLIAFVPLTLLKIDGAVGHFFFNYLNQDKIFQNRNLS